MRNIRVWGSCYLHFFICIRSSQNAIAGLVTSIRKYPKLLANRASRTTAPSSELSAMAAAAPRNSFIDPRKPNVISNVLLYDIFTTPYARKSRGLQFNQSDPCGYCLIQPRLFPNPLGLELTSCFLRQKIPIKGNRILFSKLHNIL